MIRQDTNPIPFQRSIRPDEATTMTSGRAGVVQPVGYIPLLRGDSASGRFSIDINLAEMPKPILNTVNMRVDAWFIPKASLPYFSGMDEFLHAYHGEPMTRLGTGVSTGADFFNIIENADVTTVANSDFAKSMGWHLVDGLKHNTDLIDSFSMLYNFRLAAHSSKLTRKSYASEDLADALALPRAFWPSIPHASMVPDYERALVVGNLDLDLISGSLPVDGLGYDQSSALNTTGANFTYNDGTASGAVRWKGIGTGSPLQWDSTSTLMDIDNGVPQVFAQMAGQIMGTSLAAIDKGRETVQFAKLVAAKRGNDHTGFSAGDVVMADLMRGFRVEESMYRRPWLLDSKRVIFGLNERHATDGASLADSVTTGMASATLSLNVPMQETGGTIMFTVEVVPDRLDERMADEFTMIKATSELPDALRDVQRLEPVDIVRNRRLDAKHTNPSSIYGYEPMNNQWNRRFLRLGGKFYQSDPAVPATEARAALWQTGLQNPSFNSDHWLCPANLPHAVFSDTLGDAWEAVCRHSVRIAGLTQIGDPMVEANDDYADVAAIAGE